MSTIRMTGLISGLDTESMVQELVSASSTKVDEANKSKQLVEWKKEAWADLNTKLLDFYKNALTSFKTTGSYRVKKATANDTTKVTVSASSTATNGTHTVSVKQLASSAYLTGSNIKSSGNTYTSYISAGTSINFADMTDANGNSLELEGKTISISNGNEMLEFVLGGDGDNGVANINELNEKLAANENFSGLKATVSGGKITFTNSSLKTEETTDEVTGETTTTESGTNYTINADVLGISGVASYKASETTDVDGNTVKDVTSLTSNISANYAKEFTSSDISSSTKLKDIGIAVGTTFSINGHDFVVDDSTTISSLTSGFSNMGISASFDATQGRFYLNASGTGASNDFNITSSDQSALEVLGLGSTATKIDAKDAIIEYNGVEYVGSSNTFSLNGLTITAQAVTGEYNAETGEFKNNAPINISVTTDTDSMYNTIKEFVNAYNTLIDEMNTLYNEEKTDYEPLTEEERSQLSDTQIEKWEAKAKQGLLRRDSTINSLLTRMRSILNSGIEVTNADGTTTRYSLYSLGITTSSDYTENGKLHIIGDEDDPDYADQDNILKAKLEEDPEIFAKVFSGTSDNPGFGTQIYTYFTKAMKYQVGVSSAQTFYNNLSLDDEIDDWDDKIADLNEKLQDLEDKYYAQFSAMETAMAKLQSQQSYIAALMGTSS